MGPSCLFEGIKTHNFNNQNKAMLRLPISDYAKLLQGTDITIQETHPFILAHVHL